MTSPWPDAQEHRAGVRRRILVVHAGSSGLKLPVIADANRVGPTADLDPDGRVVSPDLRSAVGADAGSVAERDTEHTSPEIERLTPGEVSPDGYVRLLERLRSRSRV